MHIQQIEIDNFKSFADKTTIPFRKGFTTVSGPNGSGKSNIIDGILFCLGLSTSRTMRAEKLTDLINNQSRRREASVTITFAHDAMAKEGQSEPDSGPATPKSGVDLLLEEDPKPAPSGDPITVSRRIKDGPNGYTSTYYLNGRVSTLTDIHEHLGQFNISPGCYNVMMQGDVAGIVNMSPMERRKIIDEIAGVAEFDRKIDQAQKELEATGANIERNTILLGEIQTRLEQLGTEREHALKYQKLRDERQSYESKLLASKFVQLKKALQATQQNMAEARKQKETVQRTLVELLAQIGQTREALLEVSNEVKRKGEDQQIAIKKQIEGLKGHISRKQDTIRFIEEQKVEQIKSVERMNSEILRQQQNIENLDAEVEGYQHQVQELQALYAKESKAYEAINQQFDHLTESSDEMSVKRSEIREQLGMAEDELARLNRESLDLDAEIKRLQRDDEQNRLAATESAEKLETLNARISQVNNDMAETGAEKKRLEEALKATQLEYSQTRVEIQNAQGRFNQLNREYVQLDAQKKAYDDVHFGRAVETVLRSGMKGIHGTLAQLGSADSEFAVALEIAMGGRLQNIVVADERVAQAAIELLQRSKAGRATMLPLTKIQPARRLPPLPHGNGIVDFAYNLMDFDSAYESVFFYALGDTLVVEDMASARPLLRQHRMVTLDGSLLEKTGAMTGGSHSSQATGNRLGNTKKIDEDLDRILKQLDAAEAEKDRHEKKLTALELKMESLKEQYATCMTQFNRFSVELDSLMAQRQELEARQPAHPESSEAAPELQKQIDTLTQEMQALETTVDRQEVNVLELRGQLNQVESNLPADKLEELRKAMADVKVQRDHYEAQLRNVNAEIKSKQLEKTHQEQGIQHYYERIEEAKVLSVEKDKEKLACQEEIHLTTLQIKELEAQTSELDEELKKLQEQRDAVQNQLLEQEKAKHIQERQITQLEEQILSYQSRKRELDPQLQAAKSELLRSGVTLEDINEDNLPTEDEVNRNIQRLTRQMESMEPVNMLAIKEYDDVNERQSELSEKIETLNREREALNVKISGYHELKRASFMKAFEHVDSHFKGIFAELSDGTGHLVLTNPEEPFSGGLTIQAQPRGKKMQRIEAMSGGEKSLTSLAFVFSLQRYMPAPFYALDEVDMNLDGINAEKLANMVKREARTAQFIVVSLRKPMIERSDRTVGVTQKRNGITKVAGVKLRDDDAEPSIAAAS